ncbi:hypothetical protein BAY61_32380 (plasmid) [Prauserella marina]|uniref:Uncharacterized protein n=1 Tax=Prauserella marina TaxID=530584 RepID=A0A222W1B9_9PSEU|nr:hypothetical protein [Prauserella marina]ASR39979.1 hypothetical protein BAY61_32380 [Prauserella marina]PWV71318.1 hypothetical protein DES30_11234 [Prauserella marina]SDD96660.1 hypothetical protein SAMN05421630_11578 [Prauserella marina]
MTVKLTRALPEPLSQRFVAVESVFSAAEDYLFELYLLDVARLVRDPFPEATALVIDVDTSDMSLALDIVEGDEELLFVAGVPGAYLPDYRTEEDNRSVLLTAVESTLETVLGDRYPQELWQPAERPDSYRVPLPPRDVGQPPLTTPPSPLPRSNLRVEVVIDRDPDNGTEAAVFLDGEPHVAEVTVVDPGRGYELAEWRENADYNAQDASPAAAALIRKWFADAEPSQFITA